METKHTPGPWDCDAHYNSIALIPFQPAKIVQTVMAESGDVAYIANWHDDQDEVEANASLIAAAPDLLYACKMILSCAGDGSLSLQTARQLARAAIKKAQPK